MPWKVPLFSETGELEWFEAKPVQPKAPHANDNSLGDIPGYADGYPVMRKAGEYIDG